MKTKNIESKRKDYMDIQKYQSLKKSLDKQQVSLVAVSKTKPNEDILELYHAGQRVFGENQAKEMQLKYAKLPKDIQWHFIGHLQRNKVKYIAPFVALIHSVDSFSLAKEIHRQGEKNNRVIDCLLQIRIAKEVHKYGLSIREAKEIIRQQKDFSFIRFRGLMGLATHTQNDSIIEQEFEQIKILAEEINQDRQTDKTYFNICSMGMSGDYNIAIQKGSNMVRIGSLLFGER